MKRANKKSTTPQGPRPIKIRRNKSRRQREPNYVKSNETIQKKKEKKGKENVAIDELKRKIAIDERE